MNNSNQREQEERQREAEREQWRQAHQEELRRAQEAQVHYDEITRQVTTSSQEAVSNALAGESVAGKGGCGQSADNVQDR